MSVPSRRSLLALAALAVGCAVGTGLALGGVAGAAGSGADAGTGAGTVVGIGPGLGTADATTASPAGGPAASAVAAQDGGVQLNFVVEGVRLAGDAEATILVTAYDASDGLQRPVDAGEVEVTLEPPGGSDVDPRTVTVDLDGNASASVTHDFGDWPSGVTRVRLDDGERTRTGWIATGAEANLLQSAGGVLAGVEDRSTTVAAYFSGGAPVAGEERRVSIAGPDGERLVDETVESDENGVAVTEYTPSVAGDYEGAPDAVPYVASLVTEGDSQAADGSLSVAGRLRSAEGAAAGESLQLSASHDGDSVGSVSVETNAGGWFATEIDVDQGTGAYDLAGSVGDEEVLVRPDAIYLESDPLVGPVPVAQSGYGVGGFGGEGYGATGVGDASGLDVAWVEPTSGVVAPGESATVRVQGGDGPVDVGVYVRNRGLQSAPLAVETGVAGDGGTVEVTVPEDAPDALGLVAEASDGSVAGASEALAIQHYRTELSGLREPVTPGGTARVDVSVTDWTGGLDAAPVMVLATDPDTDRFLGADSARIAGAGEETLEVPVPEDAGERIALTPRGRYSGGFYGPSWHAPVDHTELSAVAVGQRPVEPGGTVSLTHHTGFQGGPALVTVRARDGTALAHRTLAQGESATLAVPEGVGAGDEFVVAVRATDGHGSRFRTTRSVAVASPELEPRISVDPAGPGTGEAVTFEASASGTGEDATYEWRFGDGETATGPRVEHTYDAAGAYRVELTVSTPDGRPATGERVLVAGASELPAGLSRGDGSGGGEGGGGGGDGGGGTGSPALPVDVTVLGTPEGPVAPGEPVSVTLAVENVGDRSGVRTVELADGLTVFDTVNVALTPGERREVTLEGSLSEEGTHEFEFDGEPVATITVSADAGEGEGDGTDGTGDGTAAGAGTGEGSGGPTDGDTDAETAVPTPEEALDWAVALGNAGVLIAVLLGGFVALRRGIVP